MLLCFVTTDRRTLHTWLDLALYGSVCSYTVSVCLAIHRYTHVHHMRPDRRPAPLLSSDRKIIFDLVIRRTVRAHASIVRIFFGRISVLAVVLAARASRSMRAPATAYHVGHYFDGVFFLYMCVCVRLRAFGARAASAKAAATRAVASDITGDAHKPVESTHAFISMGDGVGDHTPPSVDRRQLCR